MQEYADELYEALKKQATRANILKNYYLGNQPLRYSHKRLEEVFGHSVVNFTQNWCAVVVDATTERITFNGWDNPNENINKELDDYYNEQNLKLVARKVHSDAVITGKGYVMLDQLNGENRIFYNSPEGVTVLHSEDNPEEVIAGIKVFKDKDDTVMMLYTPQSIEKYSAQNPTTVKSFTLIEEYPNPFGVVPIIEFSAQDNLSNVIPLQDTINKLFSDMMVVAEFNAFRQRYAITNADISKLTSAPQVLWKFPKDDGELEPTKLGEFSETNLGMYLDTIDKITNAIAIISRTPKHYFYSTGANISGEALMVMESPLIKKCQQLMEQFSVSWIKLANILIPADGTVCIWERPQTEQVKTEAEAMQILAGIGIPLITILRRFGWTQSEIDQMIADKKDEKAQNADLAAQALEIANLRLEQSNNPLPGAPLMTQQEAGEIS